MFWLISAAIIVDEDKSWSASLQPFANMFVAINYLDPERFKKRGARLKTLIGATNDCLLLALITVPA